MLSVSEDKENGKCQFTLKDGAVFVFMLTFYKKIVVSEIASLSENFQEKYGETIKADQWGRRVLEE